MEQTKTKDDFWQDHSLEYLEMALKHDYQERVTNAHGHGSRTGECGDTVDFFIMTREGAVSSISYDINGCMNTNACANTVIHLTKGKTREEMWEITPEAVVDFLKSLPSHETHCAELAVGAFYLALRDLETPKNKNERTAGKINL